MHWEFFNNFLGCTFLFLFLENICRSYCEIVAWGNPHKHNDNLSRCPSNVLLFSGRRAFSWLSHVILISDGDRLRLTSWWTLGQDYTASLEQKNRERPTSKQWLVGRASSWNALSAEERLCCFSISAFIRLWSSFGDYHSELRSKSIC